MNFYLKKFYNDVKDPSWPDVNDYLDYVRLPSHIKKECEEQHGILERLAQIEDVEYCTDVITFGYQYKNLVFVPMAKCASTYYMHLFGNNLGWKKITNFSTLSQDTVFFGVIIDPTKRWLKGITEWAWMCRFDDKAIERMFTNSQVTLYAPDAHTNPYSLLLGKWLEKVNWIPMDLLSDTDVKKAMMSLFQQHGHNIELPLEDHKIHESPPEKKQLFEKIKNYHYQNFAKESNYLFSIQTLYANDLKLYRRTAEKFLSS